MSETSDRLGDAVEPDYWIEAFDERDKMLDAWWMLNRANEPLTVLRAAAILREVGAKLREQATADARAIGATWAQIGEASKTSRQAEHRRYHQLDDDVPNDRP